MQKPFILVTNDDGIDSPGIFELMKAMKSIGDTVVIAPDRQQSAVGHALTVARPLRATKFRRNGEFFGYAVNGTPCDCVKLALSALTERKPDLIISGINFGRNTAINILYSGTVSAATEGYLLGIPSIAVSLDSYIHSSDCAIAAEYSKKIASKVIDNSEKDLLLNVNVPNLPEDEIKGMKITTVSDNIWKDHYEKRTDPFGRDYFWFAGDMNKNDISPKSDDYSLDIGYVTVSPVKYQFTDDERISRLNYLND